LALVSSPIGKSPEAASTNPFFSRVAVWPVRAVFRLLVVDHRPVTFTIPPPGRGRGRVDARRRLSGALDLGLIPFDFWPKWKTAIALAYASVVILVGARLGHYALDTPGPTG
jgi:hypothetical protein